MLPFVNVIVSPLYCMHSLHHILLDYCKYLIMKSCLWQMVRTRATNDDVIDVPEGSAVHGRGCG
jgi:hypothetical protein